MPTIQSEPSLKADAGRDTFDTVTAREPFDRDLATMLLEAGMNWQAKIGTIFLSIAAMIAGAQSSTKDRGLAQATQVRGYWVDPSMGLMWAGKDSGKDLSWKAALKYCRNLRLAG